MGYVTMDWIVIRIMEIKPEQIRLDLDVASYREALGQLCSDFKSQGLVDGEYYEEILNREQHYPTGFKFSSVGVAIPHTDYNPYKKHGIMVARLKLPVFVRRIDVPSQEIPVSFILLTLPDAGRDQLDFLMNTISIFKNESKVKVLETTQNVELMADILNGR